MATLDDVRRIALALPEVVEVVDGHRGGAAWRTRKGPVAWERPPSGRDLEQLAVLGRDWPDGVVIGVRVDGEQAKAAMLWTHPRECFTIPHFDGYPAVLIRLDEIGPDLLSEAIIDSWLLRVPLRTATQWLSDRGLG